MNVRAHRADYRNKIARDERARRNMKNDNGKRQTITLSLTRKQAHSIQMNGERLLSRPRYGWPAIDESITRQIIKKTGKLFPEIAEEERQSKLAWEIQRANSNPMEIRKKYEKQIEKAQERSRKAHNAVRVLEDKIDEELDAIINAKFDEAGITLFRSHRRGLTHADGLIKSK